MRLKNKTRQKTMVLILLCCLIWNPLTVKAEEVNDIIPEEEIIVSESLDLTLSETTKNVENINHDFFVGKNLDINVMPMTDAPNTDPNNAEIIPVNSIINDAITEDGQQRWYAFATDGGKLTLDLNFVNSTSVDYDLYLFQYSDVDGTLL